MMDDEPWVFITKDNDEMKNALKDFVGFIEFLPDTEETTEILLNLFGDNLRDYLFSKVGELVLQEEDVSQTLAIAEAGGTKQYYEKPNASLMKQIAIELIEGFNDYTDSVRTFGDYRILTMRDEVEIDLTGEYLGTELPLTITTADVGEFLTSHLPNNLEREFFPEYRAPGKRCDTNNIFFQPVEFPFDGKEFEYGERKVSRNEFHDRIGELLSRYRSHKNSKTQ